MSEVALNIRLWFDIQKRRITRGPGPVRKRGRAPVRARRSGAPVFVQKGFGQGARFVNWLE